MTSHATIRAALNTSISGVEFTAEFLFQVSVFTEWKTADVNATRCYVGADKKLHFAALPGINREEHEQIGYHSVELVEQLVIWIFYYKLQRKISKPTSENRLN